MKALIFAVAAAMFVASAFGAFAQDVKAILAPQGKLRVGVYYGSPTSMVRDSKTNEVHGLSFDLGKELAKRLNVPFEQVNYQRISDVLEGMKAGDVDFTVSNSTPARAASVAVQPAPAHDRTRISRHGRFSDHGGCRHPETRPSHRRDAGEHVARRDSKVVAERNRRARRELQTRHRNA